MSTNGEDNEWNGDSEEDAGDAEAGPTIDPALAALANFCDGKSKTKMVEELVCGNCVEDADIKCVEGKCACCGFGKYWSKGLRPKLVGADHHLLDGVSNVWETCIRWETLRSSTNTPSDGSNTDEKETLRAQRSGTIIEFLDKFEEISAQFPAHRHLVCDAKAKALRRFRYCWPGMLLSDYDWSENGIINPKYQIQSEYWSLTAYSLFISITSFLIVDVWLDRSSLLKVGAEATVEPEGAPADTLKPAEGSFWAKIHSSPAAEGEEQVYTVAREDGSIVGGITRKRLRHRKFYTKAFVGITDEKRHDSITTQHMLDKQFEHWLQQVDLGKFWAWLGHSDNASHFKSGPMMHYWSRKESQLEFLKAVWIEFGCPGHGKGPWDGMGAVIKQRVQRDLTNAQILTRSGVIESPREVAEHLKVTSQTPKPNPKSLRNPSNDLNPKPSPNLNPYPLH